MLTSVNKIWVKKCMCHYHFSSKHFRSGPIKSHGPLMDLMDLSWTPHGPLMDPSWTPHGPNIELDGIEKVEIC